MQMKKTALLMEGDEEEREETRGACSEASKNKIKYLSC